MICKIYFNKKKINRNANLSDGVKEDIDYC